MPRLLFIDDDLTELESFHNIVKSEYEFNSVHWPTESEKLMLVENFR